MKSVILKIEDGKSYVLSGTGEFQKIKAEPSHKVGMEVSTEPSIVTHKKRIHRIQSVASVAACLLIFVYGTMFASKWDEPAYYIYVDINPSIRLEVNSFNRVIDHSALNLEGIQIMENIKASGNISNTVKQIVNASEVQGYLADNEIDLTVVSYSDSDKERATKEISKAGINKYFSIKKITPDVEQAALEEGIAPVHYSLALDAVSLNPGLTLDKALQFTDEYLNDLVSGRATYNLEI